MRLKLAHDSQAVTSSDSDVRLITATTADLVKHVCSNQFRDDESDVRTLLGENKLRVIAEWERVTAELRRKRRYYHLLDVFGGPGGAMIRLDAEKAVSFCDGLRRRDFLHAGSLAFLGLTLNHFLQLKALGAVTPDKDVNCIFLMLVGGPSHLDTWDASRAAAGTVSW